MANDDLSQKKTRVRFLFKHQHLAEAKMLCNQLVQCEPKDPELWETLGAINHRLGNLDEAAGCYHELTSIRPHDLVAHFNLATVLDMQGKYESAAESYRCALHIDPARAVIHYNLGNVLHKQMKFNEAIQCYQRALQIRPNFPEALHNQGIMFAALGEIDQAIASCQCAIELKPDFVDAHNSIGAIHVESGALEHGISCYKRALTISRENALTSSNLATALSLQGKLEEASGYYREALRINPTNHHIHSDLLLLLNYFPNLDQSAIFAEHLEWGRRFDIVAQPRSFHAHNRDPNRRLKIGYVSRDFCAHSVASFIHPILAHHDPTTVETYGYADTTNHDETTKCLMKLSSHWRDIHTYTVEQVVSLIHSDRIDILVDLAGHTAFNRLPVFVHKPAPVQLTYLGYPNTTGLHTIDYRLTDINADPPGQEKFYTETLVRMPNGFLCYKAPIDISVADTTPLLTSGHVTFGSFNNLTKITPQVIALWAHILKIIPDSRLILKNKSLRDEMTRERYTILFEQHGISPENLELIGWLQNNSDHLALYNRIDIALDTFPYNGTTTTCEALWMGVPVITLAGSRHAGRVGVSLLTQLGLADYIADTPEDYVHLAMQLASNVDKLAALRKNLRVRMANSLLCDGKNFTRRLEETYRALWRQWCEKSTNT